MSFRPLAASLAVLCLCAAPTRAQDLLVSDFDGTVRRFALSDGAPLGDLGPVPGAQSMRHGPDGMLYVCAEGDDEVLRFDGATGAFVDVFVGDDPDTPDDESGGLDAPTAAVFLPDGDLAVASFSQDRILRYDGASGGFLGELVPAGVSPLNGPDAGMAIGPDGLLYVPSFSNNRILRYDPADGAFVDTFAPPAAGTLSRPRALVWRGDGVLFVTSWGNNRVLRYGLDGTYLGIFATTLRPTGIAFEPSTNDVLVTSDSTGHVLRFDGATGAPLGPLVPALGSPISAATFLAFLPDPRLRLGRPQPTVAGLATTLEIAGATPGAPVLLAVGSVPASLPIGCGDTFLGFADPLVFPVAADASGGLSVTARVPAPAAGVELRLSAFEPSTCRLSDLVVVTFD